MLKLRIFMVGLGVFLSLSVMSVYADGRVYFTNNCIDLMTVYVEWFNGFKHSWASETVTLDPGQTYVFETHADLFNSGSRGGYLVSIDGGKDVNSHGNKDGIDVFWDLNEFANAVESSPTDWPFAPEKYTDSFFPASAQDHHMQKRHNQKNTQIQKERLSR